MATVDFYATQWAGIPERLVDYSEARRENAKAINEYNTRIELGQPGVTVPLLGIAGTRRMDPALRGIIESADICSGYNIQYQLPGVVSVNTDDLTFTAYLTLTDFIRNIPQKIKIGRYFRRTGLYSDDDVNGMANRIKSTIQAVNSVTLEIARSVEDIVMVYERGPNSCMSGSGWSIHPASVYATPDIGVAYCSVNGKIVARAVINMIDDSYSTIYGNVYLLENLLLKEGYTSGDICGCRLQVIPLDNGMDSYVMPYIDSDDSVGFSDDGEYFIVGEYGYSCNSTNGTTHDGHPCACCGDFIDENDGYWIDPIEATVCSINCAEEMGYTMPEDQCGEFYAIEDLIYCESHGLYYSNSDDFVEVDGEWYPYDEVVYSDLDGCYYLEGDCTYLEHKESWVLDHQVEDYPEDEYA